MGGPPDVTPVIHDGVRYAALHWGKAAGHGQNGGLVAATEAATGRELWVRKVYEIVYGDRSPAKHDRFITKLEVTSDGRALLVTDETGARHRMDLGAGEVARTRRPQRPHPSLEDAPPGFLRRLFGR